MLTPSPSLSCANFTSTCRYYWYELQTELAQDDQDLGRGFYRPSIATPFPRDSRELVQEILIRNPQERTTPHNIADHAFFTRGIVPGFIPVPTRDAPLIFHHISPLVSQANLPQLGTPATHGCACRWYTHSWRADSTPKLQAAKAIAGRDKQGREQTARDSGVRWSW
jgi:hypothetical protein